MSEERSEAADVDPSGPSSSDESPDRSEATGTPSEKCDTTVPEKPTVALSRSAATSARTACACASFALSMIEVMLKKPWIMPA